MHPDRSLCPREGSPWPHDPHAHRSPPVNDKNKSLSLRFPNGDAYALVPITGDGLQFINPNTGVKVAFLKASRFHAFRLYGRVATRIE